MNYVRMFFALILSVFLFQLVGARADDSSRDISPNESENARPVRDTSRQRPAEEEGRPNARENPWLNFGNLFSANMKITKLENFPYSEMSEAELYRIKNEIPHSITLFDVGEESKVIYSRVGNKLLLSATLFVSYPMGQSFNFQPTDTDPGSSLFKMIKPTFKIDNTYYGSNPSAYSKGVKLEEVKCEDSSGSSAYCKAKYTFQAEVDLKGKEPVTLLAYFYDEAAQELLKTSYANSKYCQGKNPCSGFAIPKPPFAKSLLTDLGD